MHCSYTSVKALGTIKPYVKRFKKLVKFFTSSPKQTESNDDGNDNGNNNNDNGDDDTKESYRVLKSPLSSSDGGGGTLAIWGYSYNT
ncbi:6980_t:CDS:2 [Entrophospora sp. SA101]|nr:6980_t:CDS:2 [Entrophospora sp. SA101]